MKYDINYSKIPEHMRPGLERYLEYGVIPGRFLTAILENNLVDAVAHADRVNKTSFREWASFLYNEMPAGSWGSKEKVRKWSEEKSKEKE